MGSSSDFQADLLRINGHLQASITELRYRCEVYRLSLRSICKVLGNVNKEHKIRLFRSPNHRPSYQAYLLNLCQKQALDNINNVVRKASTFINGYSLIDKRLFQPPPPQPKPICRRDNQRPEAIATILDGSQLNVESSASSKSYQSLVNSSVITSSATSANKVDEVEAIASKNVEEKVGKERREKKEKRSKSKKLHKSGHKNSGSKTRSKGESSKKIVKATKIKQTCEEKSKEETNSKSISSHHHQIIINTRQQHYNDSKPMEHGQRKQSLTLSQYRNRSGPLERKSCTFYDGEKFSRAEDGRGVLRREQPNNNRSTFSVRDDQQQGKERNTVRFHETTEFRENKNEIHGNKERESLASMRTRSASATQGQGVSRKHLPFSAHRPHNNFKFNSSEGTEQVLRIQLSRLNGNTYYASRKTPTGITTRNLT